VPRTYSNQEQTEESHGGEYGVEIEEIHLQNGVPNVGHRSIGCARIRSCKYNQTNNDVLKCIQWCGRWIDSTKHRLR